MTSLGAPPNAINNAIKQFSGTVAGDLGATARGVLIRVKRIYNFWVIHANFVMFSHVSITISNHFYVFCWTNLLTRCPVPVSFLPVLYFRKCTTGIIVGITWKFTDIFYAKEYSWRPKGSLRGHPQGTGGPLPWPIGDLRVGPAPQPLPVGYPLAPLRRL